MCACWFVPVRTALSRCTLSDPVCALLLAGAGARTCMCSRDLVAATAITLEHRGGRFRRRSVGPRALVYHSNNLPVCKYSLVLAPYVRTVTRVHRYSNLSRFSAGISTRTRAVGLTGGLGRVACANMNISPSRHHLLLGRLPSGAPAPPASPSTIKHLPQKFCPTAPPPPPSPSRAFPHPCVRRGCAGLG